MTPPSAKRPKRERSLNGEGAIRRICPRCGASPGEPCIGKQGQHRKWKHAERHVPRTRELDTPRRKSSL